MSASSHVCVHCSREFARSEHLIRHERTHTKEKPFGCQLCDQNFSRRDLLRRHEKNKHGDHWPLSQTRQPHRMPPAAPVESPTVQSMQSFSSQSERGPNMYMIMPASESPMTNYSLPGVDKSTALDNCEVAEIHQNLLPFDPWQSPQPMSFGASEYLQQCLLPDDIDWFDDLSSLPDQLGTYATRPSHISQPLYLDGQGNSEHQQPPGHDPWSILSRPSSPATTQPRHDISSIRSSIDKVRPSDVSEACRQYLQRELNKSSSLILPSANKLSQYTQRYFTTFHRHQPFLHEATWSPDNTHVSLTLAVCANGALYNLEQKAATDLHEAAYKILKDECPGLGALQTSMLLIAFSAWSGHVGGLQLALELQSGLIISLRQEWARHSTPVNSINNSWQTWRAVESVRRTNACLFTVANLMSLAYDFPSIPFLDGNHGIPCPEAFWSAKSEEEWMNVMKTTENPEYHSTESIIARLGNAALPTPSKIGMFGCHVVIMSLLQKIILFRQACTGNDDGFSQGRQHFLRVLKRWQLMWETEPEASLSPDHPRGPILFNCTAILRVAYIRLVADYAPVRASFGHGASLEEIAAKIDALPPLVRDGPTTRAALQSCLALRIPVHLGFEVVSRTGFWIWSVQHALCYFECALLLTQWLNAVGSTPTLGSDEKAVLDLLQELVNSAQAGDGERGKESLAVTILRSWARLLDTGNTTVWQIMPKMAKVLRVYASSFAQATGSQT